MCKCKLKLIRLSSVVNYCSLHSPLSFFFFSKNKFYLLSRLCYVDREKKILILLQNILIVIEMWSIYDFQANNYRQVDFRIIFFLQTGFDMENCIISSKIDTYSDYDTRNVLGHYGVIIKRRQALDNVFFFHVHEIKCFALVTD